MGMVERKKGPILRGEWRGGGKQRQKGISGGGLVVFAVRKQKK